MLKRVLLFTTTNLLVFVTLSLIIGALGLHSYLTAYGIDYQRLAMFCGIWGMGGAFFSLLISKWVAKLSMGVVVIDPYNATREERYLVEMVYALAKRAGIRRMPEVGIYRSPELNAFATGPSKNHALVAVSSALLNHLQRDEIEAVLGHEISHIANGDMVTMTLVQGVLNAFVMFLSRILAYVVSLALRHDEKEEMSFATYHICTIVFDILFASLSMVVVASYSRWREYRADAGGAALTAPQQMITALRRLQTGTHVQDERAPALASFKITRHPAWLHWFSTHPPLEQRIERLEKMH